MLQSKTVGYSAVATARSALLSFFTVNAIKVGGHPFGIKVYVWTVQSKTRITALHRNMGFPDCTELPQNFSS